MKAQILAGITAACCIASPVVAQQLKISTPLSILEEAARRDSNDAAAHYNLALGYWGKRKWDQVDSSLRRSLAIDPRFASAYLALAFLPQAAGKFWKERIIVLGGGMELHLFSAPDSVVEAFNRLYQHAFMIDPLVDIRIQVATEYRGGHVDRFDRALYAYNDGKWDEAYRRFGELVGDSSEYHGEKGKLFERILWYHGLAAARLLKHEDAIGDLERLVRRSENRETSDTLYRWPLRTTEYRYVLAFLKQRAGDPNGAIDAYRDALTGDLGLYMAHVRLGDIYETAKMFSQAGISRRNAINANPDDGSLQLDLGKTLAAAGQLQDAAAALRQASDANPRDARPPFYLGLVLEQLGQKEEARAAFTQFTVLAPSRYERQIAIAKQHLAALR
jgi:tetratricopeptide (TPR) repeat protein